MTSEEKRQLNHVYNQLSKLCRGVSTVVVLQALANVLADTMLEKATGDPDVVQGLSSYFHECLHNCFLNKPPVENKHAAPTLDS